MNFYKSLSCHKTTFWSSLASHITIWNSGHEMTIQYESGGHIGCSRRCRRFYASELYWSGGRQMTLGHNLYLNLLFPV